MATPEWFFSTLAQAAATLAGLIITFSAVLYQLERRNRENRTDELREELVRFQNEYTELIGSTRSIFFQFATGKYEEGHNFEDLSKRFENVDDEITEDEYKYPQATKAWLTLSVILYLLQNIGPARNSESNYLLTNDEIDSLGAAISDFGKLVDGAKGGLRKEIRLKYSIHGEQAELANVFGEVPPDAQEHAPQNLKVESDKNTEEIKHWLRKRVDDESYLDEEFLTGQNLYSLSRVSDLLHHDYRVLDVKRENTNLDYTSSVRPILITAGLLILVGVFIPLVFLFTAPPFPTWTGSNLFLLVSEILLALLSAAITVLLLWLLYENMG